MPKDRRAVTVDARPSDEVVTVNQDFSNNLKVNDPNGYMAGRLRETPTRKGNKKWYDSTAIPFMDEDPQADRLNEMI
ncbi:unnamed protein product [Echinostoma caproni]|uniref:Uncharacterized protein n=1 Tax=Echinostoma caproni TaxID=27848 RepID=A0A3P8GFZ8_9TREM|nr:unnamed protein product [Echinostoma caproni]